jgi:N-methylhydantoinase A
VNRLYLEMEAEGRAILAAAGVTGSAVSIKRTAEMRYVGQGHEVEVPVPPGRLGRESLETLTQNFEAAYRALYGRTAFGVAIEALNWRLVVSGPPHEMRMDGGGVRAARGGRPDALKRRRPAYFSEAREFVETPVYDRYRLAPGAVVEGPAIVEERESTAVIGPGGRVTVDEALALHVELPH